MPQHTNREHANSYYAAIQRDKSSFPALEGDERADVCIIGGGLTGVATAVELSERGYKVVLLEANRIGWGASGRNGGQIIGGYGGPLASNPTKTDQTLGSGATDALLKMGTEGVDIIRERTTKYQIECDLTWGFLDVALNKRDLRDFEKSYDEATANGSLHGLRLLDAKGVQRSFARCRDCIANAQW